MYDVYQGLEGPLRLDSCLSDQKESDRALCIFDGLVEELRCEFVRVRTTTLTAAGENRHHLTCVED